MNNVCTISSSNRNKMKCVICKKATQSLHQISTRARGQCLPAHRSHWRKCRYRYTARNATTSPTSLGMPVDGRNGRWGPGYRNQHRAIADEFTRPFPRCRTPSTAVRTPKTERTSGNAPRVSFTHGSNGDPPRRPYLLRR